MYTRQLRRGGGSNPPVEIFAIIMCLALFFCYSRVAPVRCPCTASGRVFNYREPCLPELFPGCEPCSRSYRLHDLTDVFESHRLEWAKFGDEQPWWSVLTDDRWKNKRDIPEKYKDEFYGSGTGLAVVEQMFRAYVPNHNTMNRRTALDFGCGVGRTSLQLHTIMGYERVLGVDQSVGHVKIARGEMMRKGFNEDISFVVSGPDLLASLQCQKFDFVFSIIALQHMVPPLIVIYIEQMCDSLHVGGLGFVHVPTMLPADYSQYRCEPGWSMNEGGMQVWYVDQGVVQEALHGRGCSTLGVRDFDMIGIPGSVSKAFLFQKGRPPP